MKTSSKQYEIMVTYMGEHPHLCTGKLDNAYTVKDRQFEWKELAELLNADGSGPKKDVEKWRKTWNDWKSTTKAKAAKIKRGYSSTGGGPPVQDVLTPLEERLCMLYGKVWTEGISDVCESIIETMELNEEASSSYISQPACVNETENSAKSDEYASQKTKRRRKNGSIANEEFEESFVAVQRDNVAAVTCVALALQEVKVSLDERNIIEERKSAALESIAETIKELLTKYEE